MSGLIDTWRDWHSRRSLPRVSCKILVFLLILVPVLFPRVWLIPTWLSRWRDPNKVLDPQAAELAPLESALRASLPTALMQDEKAVFARAHELVRDRIPYDWDWNVWGEFDWLPTPQEALRAGREDCDGVAVVTASLIRRVGFDAQLVCDFLHVWVRGSQAQAGSLGGTPSIEVTSTGSRLRVDWRILFNAVRGTGIGVALFPLSRELILIAAIILLTLHPRVSWTRILVSSTMILAAFFALRAANQRTPISYIAAAFAVAALGWLLLAWRGRRIELPAPSRGLEVR